MSLTFFSIGIVLLYFGAEYLVRGGISLALARGIRPLVVGLTIVALGTSLPEFFVSFMGLLEGSGDIAIGNIVGSNIANIALVLAVSAIITPVRLDGTIARVELPFVIVISVVFFLMAMGGTLSRLDGAIMVAGLLSFLLYCFRSGKDVSDGTNSALSPHSGTLRFVLYIVAGSIGLMLGARLMVQNGIIIAQSFGVSELAIGITLIAVGTSLPELMTCIVASVKKSGDLSIGNIIGSNIFNLLFVCGIIALISPITVAPSLLKVDIPIMLAAIMVLYPLARSKGSIGRIEGLLLLAAYSGYMYYTLA
ncbi:cation:H+ antiporter [Desulfurispira natronophila]|uniref:Cation:H+ antiporter n=1 Tax=Desulfurispira natronophila TaxID=682562 RepID=A0A7W7Y402_9BACT|nr:cation:H+ antiporter [Desulfurispira natronophila]